MNKRAKFITTLFLCAFLIAGTTAVASAMKKEGNTRPGWGHGDKNHVHTGPPGLSVRP